MTGPLMIPKDNYSCDIVRGVPGISGVITIYSASSSCLRRTVGSAGPSGEAGGVRVQRSASEHWPVEHLHGEVSSRDLQTMSQPHNVRMSRTLRHCENALSPMSQCLAHCDIVRTP